ncbi:MAG: SIMPL domain-containing protein [Alphaproteobacteria bacterium]|nr:SIMPL domain-containing protein [Alphaproteobacteria bacterium]
MDKTVKVTFIVGLFVSVVFLWGFKTISKAIKSTSQHISISTSGSAEKIVKSDIVEVKIAIKNKDEDFSKLNEKRIADKQQVLDFLRTCGLDERDIVSINIKTENRGERQNSWGGIKISHKEQAFAAEDTIFIRTKNFESIDNMKKQIMQLASKGLIISYDCVYKILDLEKIKAELMKEAAKNAERDANVLLSPFNKKVKKLLSIYGSSSPDVMDETAEHSWQSNNGESSLMKKVKQKVAASFSYE